MQRIKTVRYRSNNIGGDRCFAKLRYTIGQQFNLDAASSFAFENMAFNVGASAPAGALNPNTIFGRLGSTPNLSTMGSLYTQYRIRGIKLRLSYWQQSGQPVALFCNAQANPTVLGDASTGPTPPFPTPSFQNVPEQRWGKYRVCQATAAGGRPTSLSVYYSVNKVAGPDRVVKNDEDYTGLISPVAPYWSTGTDDASRPQRGPWLQYGITSLADATGAVTGVLKKDAIVYVEFFGKRSAIQ